MPQRSKLSQIVKLPELKVLKEARDKKGGFHIHVEKQSECEVCPKCASISKVIYDRRVGKAHDEPIKNCQVYLYRLIDALRGLFIRPCMSLGFKFKTPYELSLA